MAADLHVHIVTPELTKEHFKCFFGSTIGSEWFSWELSECREEKTRREDYSRILRQFNEEFPLRKEWGTHQPKEARDRWVQLLEEHYERVGYTCSHYADINNTPNIWIGEVSWLKAALFEDPDSFVPDTVAQISDLCEDFPVITDEWIKKIVATFDVPNNTAKKDGVNMDKGYSLAIPSKVEEFLREHMGKKVFTISW